MSYLLPIPPHTGDNLSGVLKISVARKVDILTYPEAYDGVAISELVFKEGKSWTLWHATYRTASFSSRSSDSMEGIIRDQQLPFIIPRHSVRETMLHVAERDEFVVLVEDANMFRYLFGSLQKPVRFSYDKNTGSGSQRNQYDCLFYSEAVDNTLIYPHTFDTPGTPEEGNPVIIRRGSPTGPVLAVASPGSTVVITSPYSFGFELLSS